VTLSVCATNYNCAHALERHLRSVYGNLAGLGFEYIVVDNASRDGSQDILRRWAAQNENLKVSVRRSTMGDGRQLAFEQSSGSQIMVLDTDVVYTTLLRRFVDRYFERYRDFSVQAIFCAIFPREQWLLAGGRRSLNTNEDVDMWLRVLKLGTMRWYPVPLGENLKEPLAWGESDHLSSRYAKGERIVRLLRREWDLLKTRQVRDVDLESLVRRLTIDFELGPSVGTWPQRRVRVGRARHAAAFVRDLRDVLRIP